MHLIKIGTNLSCRKDEVVGLPATAGVRSAPMVVIYCCRLGVNWEAFEQEASTHELARTPYRGLERPEGSGNVFDAVKGAVPNILALYISKIQDGDAREKIIRALTDLAKKREDRYCPVLLHCNEASSPWSHITYIRELLCRC